MSNNDEILENLTELETALQSSLAGHSKLTGDELCKFFCANKELIKRILPWLGKIPKYGSQLEAIFKFLVEIAERLCACPDK